MDGVKLGGKFEIKCFDKTGKLKWKDTAKNIVVNVGLYHILDILFVSATSQIDPWYVGLVDDTPSFAAGDTLASHAGWTENANYTGDRKEFVDVRSGASVGNSASKASFSIDTDSQTIAGAFLCSAASGTSGTLLCEAPFTGGDKSVDDGDTLEVTYTFTAADDGA